MNNVYQEALLYLKYIRDISKKFSVDGFERVYVKNKKGNKKNNFFVKVDYESLESKLNEIMSKVNLDRDDGIFIGYGAIYGKFKDGSKEIGGPVVVKAVTSNNSLSEEFEDKEKVEYVISNKFFINYDIFSKFLPTSVSSDDEYDLFIDDEKIIEDFLKFVEETEANSLEKEHELAELIFDEFMKRIKVEGAEISSIKKEDSRPEEKLKAGEIIFTKEIYIFKAKVPHELTVHNSINSLIEELKEMNTLDNKVLTDLFIGLFDKEPYKVESMDDEVKVVGEFIDKYIYISLSQKQKEAIVRAFSSPISYIQGPPGTGKSHTITAMAFIAMLLNKKILIVSHKEPAVKVVKEKLEQFLGNILYINGTRILPYVYISQNSRSELKQEIKNLLNLYSGEIEKNIQRYKKELENIKLKLNKIYTNIENMINNLEKNIQLQEEYNEIHKKLVSKRQHIEETYYKYKYDKISYHDSMNFRINYKEIERLILLLKKLRESIFNKYKLRVYSKILLYMNQKLSSLLNMSTVKESFGATRLEDYIRNVVDLSRYHSELENIINELNQYDPEELRKNIAYQTDELNKIRQEYIKHINALRVLELLKRQDINKSLGSFKSLLHYRNPNRQINFRKNVDYEKLLETFPVWICESKLINEVIPMKANLFDLVVIDEASQVNLAEIIPIVYRGKALCIVGDHKQLSLVSTGLPLNLSTKFDKLTWTRYKPAGISYDEASKMSLTVTKSSILDLIISEENNINVPSITLDEHFRSLPLLASFTNDRFYQGELKIMTETPEKMSLSNSFALVKLKNSKRDTVNKYSIEEAKQVIEILKSLKNSKRYDKIDLSFLKDNFTVGVITPIRAHAELIRELLNEESVEQIPIGTPEELQGHEFDVSIITLSIDENSAKSINHYEEKRRFNVMTSRAKYFTFLVCGQLPGNFTLTRAYIKHFGYNYDDYEAKEVLPQSEVILWKFDEKNFESEFEKQVYNVLFDYVNDVRIKRGVDIKIFNQVRSCGRRLDFVVYNPSNKKYVAIEVDGIHHFETDGRTYNINHIERIESLKRAGWKIIHTQYYKWFDRYGRPFDESHEILKREKEKLKKLLDDNLFY